MRSKHSTLSTQLPGPLKPPDNDLWSDTSGRFRTCVRHVAAIWTCPQIPPANSAAALCTLAPCLALAFRAPVMPKALYTSNAQSFLQIPVPVSQCKGFYSIFALVCLHYAFAQWHCNHRCKPSWVPLPPSSHFHTWKPLNYTDKALFSCISTKLSLYFCICPYCMFFPCLLYLTSSPCTCESAMRIKKLLSRHRLLFIFIFYYSILLFLLLSQLGNISS